MNNQREILFKGFHENPNGKQIITLNGKDYRGDWVEGFYAEDDNLDPAQVLGEALGVVKTVYKKKEVTPCIIDKEYGEWRPILPETVCEFTGLTDKGGKRIWEGDNIRVFGGESNDEFCEYDNTFVLEMPNPDHLGQIRDAENVEVIGDIFNTRSVK